MNKKTFVSKEQIEEIVKDYPTPFHLYDEKGIRENAKAVKEAFAWNKGFREYFAVKATPNPYILNILKGYDCGCDCSSMTELMLSEAIGVTGEEIMFSSNDTPLEEFAYANKDTSFEFETFEWDNVWIGHAPDNTRARVLYIRWD